MKIPSRLIFPALAVCFGLFPAPGRPQESAPAPGRQVLKVFDGDTLLLAPGEKVRLIGIDALEIHPGEKLGRQARIYGRKAKEIQGQGKKSKKIVEKLLKGKTIRLAPGLEDKDAYGRTLAYVYFTGPEDKVLKILGKKFSGDRAPEEREFMLNRLMVQYGWAEAMKRYPFAYLEEFQGLQAEAKRLRLGMWKKILKVPPVRSSPRSDPKAAPDDVLRGLSPARP